jgi:hypothetical protein
MSSNVPEEVLELSYEELQSRFEYHLYEWKAQRDTALRTFTASLLFLSVTVAVISVFPDRFLLQYSSQPVTDTREFIGPIIGTFGIMFWFMFLVTSLIALYERPQSLTREAESTILNAVCPDSEEIIV